MLPWPHARLFILSPQVSLPTCTKIGFLCSVSLILTPSRSELHASAAGNADAALSGVDLSLFLELINTARGYSKSWVRFAPFMGCRDMWCTAQLSRRSFTFDFFISSHPVGTCAAHLALSFDQPIDQGLIHSNLEPDEQHVDHSDRNLYGPVLRRERPV